MITRIECECRPGGASGAVIRVYENESGVPTTYELYPAAGKWLVERVIATDGKQIERGGKPLPAWLLREARSEIENCLAKLC